jgi:hypothetical protein
LVDVLAGTVAVVETLPDVQGTVEGRPLVVCLDEKAQRVALLTWADSVTFPPVEVREEGVATNDVTVGGAEAGSA